MTVYNVQNRASMAAGQAEDVSVILANFDLLASVLANIDNTNVLAAALSQDRIIGGVGLQKIATVNVAAPTPDIIFSAIPQTYNHLRLILRGRTGSGVGFEFNGIRFNNSSSASYCSQIVQGAAATVGAVEGINITYGYIGYGTGVGTGEHACFVVDIPIYSTVAGHSWTGTFVTPTNNGSAAIKSGTAGGFINIGAAISQINLVSAGGNWVAGSVATLWGLY